MQAVCCNSTGYLWNHISEDPYEIDANGNNKLDEKREPIRVNRGYGLYGNGFRVYNYSPLPEEVNILKELIEEARPIDINNDIMEIIMEETEPYFQGQKSVDEVAKVIQSRISIYISENSSH